MIRRKISILTGLAVVGGCAIVFAAMRGANPVWAGVVGSITFFLLMASLLGVGYGRGPSRAFWVGFAVLGWAFMALTSIPWLSSKVLSVLAIPLFDDLFPMLHPAVQLESFRSPFGGGIQGGYDPSGTGVPGMGGGGFRSVANETISRIAAIGVAQFGGGGFGGMAGPGGPVGPPSPAPTADLQSFRTIGRNLEALIWAFLGGWIARTLRVRVASDR